MVSSSDSQAPAPSPDESASPSPGLGEAPPTNIPLIHQSNHPLPLSALAALLGCTRSTVRHFADRLGFRFTIRRIGPRHKRAACLTPEQCNAIAAEVTRDAAAYSASSSREAADNPQLSTKNPQRQLGVFYLLQLEPEKDPGRIKLGFTADLESRLDDLLTAAPFTRCIATWPAYRRWEHLAIEATSQVATQIRQEVYHCENIEDAIAAANAFFAALPKPPELPTATRRGVVPTPTPNPAEGSQHSFASRAEPATEESPPRSAPIIPIAHITRMRPSASPPTEREAEALRSPSTPSIPSASG